MKVSLIWHQSQAFAAVQVRDSEHWGIEGVNIWLYLIGSGFEDMAGDFKQAE